MNVHDSCETSNKHNTLFDSEIFKGSSVMLVIKCACPVYPLHIHYITSFIHTYFHLAISTVSKLRHFPDSLSPAYMYKIYLHFIEKSNSLNESPMEGNTFRFIYVKNFYKCLFNSTQ